MNLWFRTKNEFAQAEVTASIHKDFSLMYDINSPPQVIHYNLFLGCGYLLWSVFYFYSELALETWDKSFLILCMGVHDFDHTHSLVSFQWSGKCFSWQKTVYSTRKSLPTRGEEWFLCLFVPDGWEMVQPVLTRAILQPAKAAAMCYNTFSTFLLHILYILH